MEEKLLRGSEAMEQAMKQEQELLKSILLIRAPQADLLAHAMIFLCPNRPHKIPS